MSSSTKTKTTAFLPYAFVAGYVAAMSLGAALTEYHLDIISSRTFCLAVACALCIIIVAVTMFELSLRQMKQQEGITVGHTAKERRGEGE